MAAALGGELTRVASEERRRRSTLALTGGRTARALYTWLGARGDGDRWARTSFVLSDERLVSYDDPESNARGALDDWLRPVGFSDDVVRRPDLGAGDPVQVAAHYEADLRVALGRETVLDTVLLSLGEDGHIASLFPDHAATRERDRLVTAVIDSPKPPAGRITMTLPLLNRARRVHLMVVGEGKADALETLLRGPVDPVRCPAQGLRPWPGVLTVWADDDAVRTLAVERGSR